MGTNYLARSVIFERIRERGLEIGSNKFRDSVEQIICSEFGLVLEDLDSKSAAKIRNYSIDFQRNLRVFKRKHGRYYDTYISKHKVRHFHIIFFKKETKAVVAGNSEAQLFLRLVTRNLNTFFTGAL